MNPDNTLETNVRQEFANLSKPELWDIADLRFLFRDDADSEMVKRYAMRRRVAMELSGYDDFYDGNRKPEFTVPDDPLWCSGLTSNPAYDFVNTTYPGITDYVAWARACPPAYIWKRVARYDQWLLMERTLKAAHSERQRIQYWPEINDALLHAAIRQHLGLRPKLDDLRTYRRDEVDPPWFDS
jgi:hypothetical protein